MSGLELSQRVLPSDLIDEAPLGIEQENREGSDSRIVDNRELTAHRVLSPMEQKALKLLGSGQSQRIVASTLGVTEGRISQLMAMEWFAAKVTEDRYHNATKHKKLDDNYDSMEERLQDKLSKQIPMMFKSQEILKALQIVNAAKRKTGVLVDTGTGEAGVIVNLTMPTQIVNRFTVNSVNQVVEVNGESLITATPAMLATKQATKVIENKVVQSGEAKTIPSQGTTFSPGHAISPDDLI